MNARGPHPKSPEQDDPGLEAAIAEFLIAEDEGGEFDVSRWLEKHAAFRDRLEDFLESHRRAQNALGQGSLLSSKSSANSLHETTDFVSSMGGPIPSEDLDPSDGNIRIGGYRLLRLLGSGGMGRVYEAVDEHGHRFAVKVIAGSMAGHPDSMERFKQEGWIASSINHPRCVFVHAADTSDGQPYIAMELMPGTTLRDWVENDGPMPVPIALEKILDVIDGLIAAHSRKLIHRDVKPSNCYVDEQKRVKVGDFGLARSLDLDAGLTRTGSMVGTPLFASPEQLRGESLDGRSDIYSTCATLYYLLAGKAPFQHSNATAVIARALSEEMPSIRDVRPDVPAELEQVLRLGMSRDRELRPRDMLELRSALQQFLPGKRRVAGIGMRFAAYCIDLSLFSFLVAITAAVRPEWFINKGSPATAIETHLLVSAAEAIYFLVCEYRYRTTLGKRLMGLRVQSARSGQHLAWTQIATRVFLWWLCSGAPTDLLLHTLGQTFSFESSNLYNWIFYLIGYAVIALPLLWRSDQRMLHDLGSGTRMDAIPAPEPPRPTIQLVPEAPVSRYSPERFGRFEISGGLAHELGDPWWQGRDPQLDRMTWIVEHDSETPVSEIRQRMARPTRLRWVGGGFQGGKRWDAFLAADSMPLEGFQRSQGAVDWSWVQRALSEVIDELQQPQPPETYLRSMLDISRWRLTRNGHLLWMDRFQQSELEWSNSTDIQRLQGDPSERDRIAFIREVASGRPPRSSDPSSSSDTPLPGFASRFLDLLERSESDPSITLKSLRESLRVSEDRPSLVTFRMRVSQLAIQAVLGLLPFGALLSLVGQGNIIRLGIVQDELLRLYALERIVVVEPSDDAIRRVLNLDADPPSDPAAYVETWKGRLESEIQSFESLQLNARQRLSSLDRTTMNALHEVFVDRALHERLQAIKLPSKDGGLQWILPAEIPASSLPLSEMEASQSVRVEDLTRQRFASSAKIHFYDLKGSAGRMQRTPGQPEYPKANRMAIVAIAPWVLLALWGTLFRGGIARRVAGMMLVDRRGRPAAWARIAWRMTLLWAPFGLLLFSTNFLEYFGWLPAWASFWMRITCTLLPFVYLALGVLSSRRGWHDVWSGTWMVPR